VAAPESFDAKLEALSALVRSGARHQALQACIDSLAPQLGRFCQTLRGDQALTRDCLHELLFAF
jgi:hypothetical protein